VARLAALTQTESAWRPTARSKYARGLTQFTPETAVWIAEIVPELAPADALDPIWSLHAMSYFTKWLYVRIKPMQTTMTECDRWAMALSAYNGGLTWVKRDRALAIEFGSDPDRWWGHVEKHSNRADWAIDENRKYPTRILIQWEPQYIAAGWAGKEAC